MSKPQDNEPRRSLWEVMGHSGNEADGESTDNLQSAPDEEAAAKTEEDGESTDQAVASSDAERPKGLWALMQTETADESATTDAVPAEETAPELEEDEAGAYSDSSVSESEADWADVSDEDYGEDELDDSPVLSDDDEEDGWDVDDPHTDLDTVADLIPESPPEERDRKERFPLNKGALFAGIASCVLAGLTLLPGFVVKLPATLVGILALMLGYQAIGNSRRDQERSGPPVSAVVGMTLGLSGIFAGPMYLNQFGESLRSQSTQEVVEQRLGMVSTSLDQYGLEQGHYPAGGVFGPGEDGLEVARESWMTALLPYMGYLDLHDMIDHNVAWDSEVNAEALRHTIPEFLVPNVDHKPTGRGFATAHFAGVGGQIQTVQGLLPTGIFAKNSEVSPNAITDGKSQTIIVGEIARALPAWGDPENWRNVDSGLNKRLSSFGNAAGTGAYFLFADGSVKFLSNRTSQRVLESLATRNASD